MTTGPGSGGWMIRFEDLSRYIDDTGVAHSNAYNSGVQVGPDMDYMMTPYRDKLHVFAVQQEVTVGTGHALANPQYGPGGAAQAWSPHLNDALLRSGSNEYFQRIGGVTEMTSYGPASVDRGLTATRGEVTALRHALHSPWRATAFFGATSAGGE